MAGARGGRLSRRRALAAEASGNGPMSGALAASPLRWRRSGAAGWWTGANGGSFSAPYSTPPPLDPSERLVNVPTRICLYQTLKCRSGATARGSLPLADYFKRWAV
jgi:hypothetical protein